ncbi:hypothetical protein SS50377_28647 [Spironucleus salmonicida]|uniref:Uncharacterized protein n=1 Tax=Spironucleus salmonicida TaxID=348837 RepID=V6LAP5_9EUKA|nr:hypothetical protein SS50377_28647 [Spironucleus salmonicida]|eukprot:EST41530.1 Hypothetical protein SS50377_18867 [Spironucleus salmonicida]
MERYINNQFNLSINSIQHNIQILHQIDTLYANFASKYVFIPYFAQQVQQTQVCQKLPNFSMYDTIQHEVFKPSMCNLDCSFSYCDDNSGTIGFHSEINLFPTIEEASDEEGQTENYDNFTLKISEYFTKSDEFASIFKQSEDIEKIKPKALGPMAK